MTKYPSYSLLKKKPTKISIGASRRLYPKINYFLYSTLIVLILSKALGGNCFLKLHLSSMLFQAIWNGSIFKIHNGKMCDLSHITKSYCNITISTEHLPNVGGKIFSLALFCSYYLHYFSQFRNFFFLSRNGRQNVSTVLKRGVVWRRSHWGSLSWKNASLDRP